MISNKNHCLIYAHKGLTEKASDNTRRAFNHALCHKIEGIETDVQLTKDNICILYHDRLMTQLGYPKNHICDFTFEQLKQINFSCYPSSTTTEGPVTFAEFIDNYQGQCKLQIEIKHRDWEDTLSSQIKIQHCLSIIGEPLNNDIILSSFTMECLQYAHQLGTQIPLIYAFRDSHSFIDVKNRLNHYPFINGICHPIQTLDSSLMHFLHNAGKQVIAYTCNTFHDIQKALDLKVDILITDDPASALKMRNG